jgi:hypothetical protein
MDMSRWEWIPRFLNAYIDARVEDEVKKRIGTAQREEGAESAKESKALASAEVHAAALPKTKRKQSRSREVKRVSVSHKRSRVTKVFTQEELLRELRETRRYLERLEAQLVQITAKAGYTDFLGTQKVIGKADRRSL